MFFKHKSEEKQIAYRRGFKTAMLISSPFIIAGVKWMMDHKEHIMEQMKQVKCTSMYTHFFDKEKHAEKEVTQKMRGIREHEGNYEVEAAMDDDKKLLQSFQEIAKDELVKSQK